MPKGLTLVPSTFPDVLAPEACAALAPPRRFPRVTTERLAWFRYGDRLCVGDVVSLSEGGCLFRGDHDLPTGQEAVLLFWLPPRRVLRLRANTIYRSGNDVGLVFLDGRADVRSIISGYVMDELLTH